jgi:hypothetical protein
MIVVMTIALRLKVAWDRRKARAKDRGADDRGDCKRGPW